MSNGYIAERVVEPNFKSVKEFDQHAKRQKLFTDPKEEVRQREIVCQCCGQQAPIGAAALYKVQDTTPYSKQFDGEPGKQVWMCADCYHTGVRPKHVHFGEVKWNKQGRRIKARAEKTVKDHPW